jgi:hypothetical protein
VSVSWCIPPHARVYRGLGGGARSSGTLSRRTISRRPHTDVDRSTRRGIAYLRAIALGRTVVDVD